MVGNEQTQVWRDKFFPPTPDYLFVWIHRRPISTGLCSSRVDLKNGQEGVQQELLTCVCTHMHKTESLLSKPKSHMYILVNLFYLYFASLQLMQQMATLSNRDTTFVTLNMIIVSFLGLHSSLWNVSFALRLSHLLSVFYTLLGGQVKNADWLCYWPS